MKKQEWLALACLERPALASLIRNYHPSNRKTAPKPLKTSAPAAQAACNLICKKIAAESDQSPDIRFSNALALGDVAEIHNLLSDTWFGVPETTGCWKIRGFKVAVDLLDDPPK